MNAVVLSEYRQLNWTTVPTPTFDETSLLIRVHFAGICGSDLHVFNGDFHPRTPVPFIPGHEFAGTVVEVGRQVQDFNVGDLVSVDPIVWCGDCPACRRQHYPACSSLQLVGIDFDGGFAEYVAVKADMVYKIPAGIPSQHAALVEVLAIGFHACKRAGVAADDSLAIWGAGRVGQCILQAARTFTEAPVFLVDVIPERLQIAASHSDNIVAIDARSQDSVAVIQEATHGDGVDIAFEAVGHPLFLETTIEPVLGCGAALRPAGTICVLGLADHAVPVVFKDLIWKEARIVTSRVSHGEFKDTLEALQQQKLKPDLLISDVRPASEAQQAFEQVETAPEKHLKILFDLGV